MENLLLMLGPEILSHALWLMHACVLVVQVLGVLDILLCVWIRVGIVRLLSAREGLMVGRLPAVTCQMRAARHTAVLRSIGSRWLEGVWERVRIGVRCERMPVARDGHVGMRVGR